MVKLEDVLEALNRVVDPEIDLPITKLGFVENIEITEDGSVKIHMRLPTYWCAPNFAYLMMKGVKDEVSRVRGVKSVTVLLKDHFAATELNEGLLHGKSFEECLPNDLITGSLDELKRTFDEKAYLARQVALLSKLLASGLTLEEVTKLKMCDVELDKSGTDITVRSGEKRIQIPKAGHIFRSYLNKMQELGIAISEQSPLFLDSKGKPMDLEEIRNVIELSRIRRLNFKSNAILCTALLSSRYNLDRQKLWDQIEV
jgi:metal-sulfur cluster biosynthetic enzyme